ncbi:MAG: VWA domain-containing protein [Myxococcales bacterium]|nr:VWA domain-containing protein [Myxococcales bacterium]
MSPLARLRRCSLLALLALPCVAAPSDAVAQKPGAGERERERRPSKRMAAPAPVYDFAAEAIDANLLNPDAASLGATPGGAQDIGYARDRAAAGEIPHPNTFTPEGLFSEHDLPVAAGSRCAQTLCVRGEAIEATLLAQPEVRYLAQLGFASGLDPKTFQRAPLNLVVIVDRSGSMSGQPLELVRKSLHEVVRRHLRPGDRIAIVGYHSNAHIVLPSTPADQRRQINAAIDQLVSEGATALEDGLKLGFQVARQSKRGFRGTTRVMLFTDERPNVGRTDAGSFMAMAEQAAREGIGMTTVGVSTHFGAELATKVSSVRGGNLFFFPDANEMTKKFEESFDTMVTELAYDLKLTVRPAPGVKIAGVYGIPGAALKWQGDAIELDVKTIFLSRKKGAIYLGFAPSGSANLPATPVAAGARVGHVALGYVDTSGHQVREGVNLTRAHGSAASLGLTRGRLLVDEITTLRKATELHHEANDQEGAYRLVHALAGQFRHLQDPTLAGERALVLNLEATLARLSGHAGEADPEVKLDRVSGLPPKPSAVIPASATRHNLPQRSGPRNPMPVRGPQRFDLDGLTP